VLPRGQKHITRNEIDTLLREEVQHKPEHPLAEFNPGA
jgi:hypothetical protein